MERSFVEANAMNIIIWMNLEAPGRFPLTIEDPNQRWLQDSLSEKENVQGNIKRHDTCDMEERGNVQCNLEWSK